MRDFFADIDWSRWLETLWTTGVRVVVIVVALYFVLWLVRRALEPAVRATVAPQMQDEPQSEIDQRVETLTDVSYRTIQFLAAFVGLLTILPEFGINIGALLAAAGLVGLAVGFGAQSLVKDFISGIFILIENQYSKGDVVNIAGVTGKVELVDLRRTVLRDLDGAVHHIPNGEITVATNVTSSISNVNTVIGVSYGDDLDHVFAVINRTGEELASDSDWSALIVSPPKVLGVDGFGDSSVDIRIVGQTQPGEQFAVLRELRLRLKKAFDAEGIEIPFPHTTLVTAKQKAADGVLLRQGGSAPER